MSRTQPFSKTAPRIELAPMPQLAEAISREDDWTGIKDAAARRRAQTRLNTRAYPLRKKAEEEEESSNATRSQIHSEDTLVACWNVSQESVSPLPTSRVQQLHNAKKPLLSAADHTRNSQRQQKKIIFPLSSDHLITLLQYNVLRALATNRSLISGILTTPLDCAEEETIHVLPYPTNNPALLPPTLLPTTLQQTTPHGDWIDIFPCPVARDRLIRAAGTFDEDELWADCIGGLYEGFPDDEIVRRGMIVWSPPWDIAGWEMSEGFLRKWGWLLRGGTGALEATNRWRGKRGEEPLVEVV
ncbi:hypothetical protein BJY01DRAFT_257243 [Aspergillus pseudoustus]|uniref:Uncharacterized protein n=1 Tax=Aspergillus pseudoustus TaxID=1810923 RepID=A0ABR4JLX1_9EURO